MKQAIEAMHRAFSSLSSGESLVPPRYVSRLPSGELVMLFKPAYVEKEQKTTIKFLTQRDGTHFPGIPTIQGVVLVVDALSGELLSIMDGEYLTALRTSPIINASFVCLYSILTCFVCFISLYPMLFTINKIYESGMPLAYIKMMTSIRSLKTLFICTC